MLHVAPPSRRPPPDPRVFAALGDETRLFLLERLREAPGRSITALAAGTPLTRQAVTRHLEVLADAGFVRDERHGRERVWTLRPEPLAAVADWADQFRKGWDARLDRLDAYLTATEGEDP